MSVWAVSVVRDEADIIASTVTRILAQVDGVIVADNGSRDGTRDLLADLEDTHRHLHVHDDEEPGHYQSRKMSWLAALAAEQGAEWVVPFDADEVWYSRWGTVGDTLRALPANEGIAPAVLYDHVTTGHDDPTIIDPTERITWRRRDPLPLHKVAVRPVARVVIEDGNHGAHYVERCPNPVLEVRHFPYRSGAQMMRKALNGADALAATDLPATTGQHWRDYAALIRARGEDAFVRDVYLGHFHAADPAAAGLVHDPCP